MNLQYILDIVSVTLMMIILFFEFKKRQQPIVLIGILGIVASLITLKLVCGGAGVMNNDSNKQKLTCADWGVFIHDRELPKTEPPTVRLNYEWTKYVLGHMVGHSDGLKDSKKRTEK